MFKAAPTSTAPSITGYGGHPPPGAQASGITFDRFVRACVVIKQLTEAFQKVDTDRVRFLRVRLSTPIPNRLCRFLRYRIQDGWIQINYDQFMQIVLTAP